jgi:hypothetical protein
MKRKKPEQFKFTLEELANFICEFTRDGERYAKRDVIDWFMWFEAKCGLKESNIRFRGRKVKL